MENAGGSWKAVQVAFWLAGAALFGALVLAPEVGIAAFWNLLIPIAPALLAFAPGLWRNVCPLGSTALLAHRQGWSRRWRLPEVAQGWMALGGVALLFGIVPLRHAVLNFDGPATALVLGVLTAGAVAVGFLFEAKSGWCSGLCPIHPVERLYGSAPLLTLPNAHCGECRRCVLICPDSTVDSNGWPKRPATRRIALTVVAGGFPGFVWGYYQVPDEGWSRLGDAYAYSLGGAAATLAVFLALRAVTAPAHHRRLVRTFAALAIGTYYWFRVPMLFGFGTFPGDGLLVDLHDTLPAWFPQAWHAATVLVFGWWLFGRAAVRRAWLVRPPYALSEETA